MINFYEIDTEYPHRTTRWAWINSMRNNIKNVLKYFPTVLPNLKVADINFILDEGVNGCRFSSSPRQDAKYKLLDMIYAEYAIREENDPNFKLASVAQTNTQYIIKYNLKWDHFTNVNGIMGLYKWFSDVDDKKNKEKVYDMIMDFNPSRIKKLLKSWPEYVCLCEEGKFHEKIDNIRILSVYYRHPELRKYLTKEYYELLKQTVFMESLADDSEKRRTYREIKFFDNWNFDENRKIDWRDYG